MMMHQDKVTEEHDVFMRINVEQNMLTPLAETMNVEIAVDKHFHAYIFYNSDLCAKMQYALYDIVKRRVALVNESGMQRDLGLNISSHIHEYLQYAQEVRLLEMKGDTLFRTFDIPLLIQQ